MKIAVITAMPEEFAAVARCMKSGDPARLTELRGLRSSTAGHDIVLVQSGMGFDNAARTAAAVIQEIRPDLVISVGFCGGIAPELRVGDVVVAEKIVIATVHDVDAVPVGLSTIGNRLVDHLTSKGIRAAGGTFASTREIMSKAYLAGLLANQYCNPVVEMESGAVAQITAEHGTPLLAIRAVSDAANEELGFALDEFCDPELRRILIHKVLLTVLRKPRIIPQLMRLARGSRAAADGLSAALACLFSLFENASGR
jgi:adenosylhomocysteine nucleosidase